MSSKLFFAALATSAVAATPAFAQRPHDQAPSLRVSYANLDVTTSQGAEELMQRINDAARNVCGGASAASSHDLRTYTAHNACKAQAIEHAVDGANLAMLTELYDRRHDRAHAVFAAR